MHSDFDSVFTLRLSLKAAREQNERLRNGKEFVRIQKEYERDLREKDRIIRKLEQELGRLHASFVTMRNRWQEVFDDVRSETDRELKKKDKEVEAMQGRVWRAERQRDEALDKLQKEREKKYQALTELEEERGKNKKLLAQINRDHENSSKPSSADPNHKKITNNREKSGKKPGGQPGHKGHRRPIISPTEPPIMLEVPDEILNDPDYYETDEVITKKVIELQLQVIVKEYSAKVYRRRSNGSRYHAPFPPGVVNEINYGGTAKAFAFVLNNYLNVPILKTQEFLSDLTDGEIRMSGGFINGLSKEFSTKTEDERAKLFSKLLSSKVMYTDATGTRVNGEGKHVFICTNGNDYLYFFREHKGHKGIEGTPVELYDGILVHDHDKTFYSYGSNHQECLAHILRYLKDSMQNEAELEWNSKMHEFLRSVIHEHKQADRQLPEQRRREIRKEYDRILQKAQDEYEEVPPSDYYRDGFNLQKRLREYKNNVLLFLDHPTIKWTNNDSERGLRKHKRKLNQMVTFRSRDRSEQYCDALGIIESGKHSGISAYQTVLSHF